MLTYVDTYSQFDLYIVITIREVPKLVHIFIFTSSQSSGFSSSASLRQPRDSYDRALASSAVLLQMFLSSANFLHSLLFNSSKEFLPSRPWSSHNSSSIEFSIQYVFRCLVLSIPSMCGLG